MSLNVYIIEKEKKMKVNEVAKKASNVVLESTILPKKDKVPTKVLEYFPESTPITMPKEKNEAERIGEFVNNIINYFG